MKNLKRPAQSTRVKVQGTGNPAVKFRIMEPILRSLHNNRLIYRERFIALVESPDLIFDKEGIRGNVKIVHFLFIPDYLHGTPCLQKKEWHFGNSWEHSMLSWDEDGLLRIGAPYCGWVIWPQAKLVAAVEAFAEQGDMKSALYLINPPGFELKPTIEGEL